MFVYLGKQKDGKLQITDWHGKVLSTDVRLLSVKNMRYSMISDKLLYLRFRYNGKIWSGVSPGAGMYVKARLTKLKTL